METYISIDIEASGPIPGPNYMLSFGAVAFDHKGNELGTFSANLVPLPGAVMDYGTEGFWQIHPDAYAAATTNMQRPENAMPEFLSWLQSYKKVQMIGYPITYDFMWLHWYLHKFTGKNPSSFSGLDIKTMAWAALGALDYKEANKNKWMKEWFPENVNHSHIAVEDAREQGLSFFLIRKELRRMWHARKKEIDGI